MILRRLTQHVRTQNWFAVTLDFLIVVLGIFVGLQVSSWNENRQDQVRAQEYLERIHIDLSMDHTALSNRIEFWSDIAEFAEIAVAYAEGARDPSQSNWDVLLAFYQASQVWEYFPVDTTYSELRNAGELHLIEDADLRSELARYYAVTTRRAATLFSVLPAYRERIRGYFPYPIQAYVWTDCHRSELDGQTLLDCESPIDEATAAALLDELTASTELIQDLRFWLTGLNIIVDLAETDQVSISNLADHVTAQIRD
jgi:hypothetical protein